MYVSINYIYIICISNIYIYLQIQFHKITPPGILTLWKHFFSLEPSFELNENNIESNEQDLWNIFIYNPNEYSNSKKEMLNTNLHYIVLPQDYSKYSKDASTIKSKISEQKNNWELAHAEFRKMISKKNIDNDTTTDDN